MTNYTDNVSAQKVFAFFTEIAAIPHGSGNTRQLAKYCLDFAEKRGLESYADANGNLLIRKPGTKGYASSPPVVIQGHLDMVCETEENCSVDMQTQGISLCSDGTYLYAEGTTLGGDDGIAVAYMLALLDGDDIPHPPIEALFTDDEEVGLLGANAFDVSVLHGKRIINIDSEKEGILMVSCAGGVRASCNLPLRWTETLAQETAFEVEISGLKGGHSGIDIGENRKNAHRVLGGILEQLKKTAPFAIAALEGGRKTNVIPNRASAVLCMDRGVQEALQKAAVTCGENLRIELGQIEPGVTLTVKPCPCPQEHTDPDSTKALIYALRHIPDGIQTMSPDIPGMVQTSLNMGELSIEEHALHMGYLIRSNAAAGKQILAEKLQSFLQELGGEVTFFADYPPWEYRAESPLRDTMVQAYEQMYGAKPEVAAIHAGLECGILAGKMSGADIVSFGPDLENVHTPKERMGIASAVRCWEYLLKVLEMLK